MTECTHCKKEMERALEDFSGRWYCPSCLHELFPTEESKLRITPESGGYFVRSERLFKEGWLLKRDVFGFKGDLALTEAVKQCRASAALNDPYALVSLASYYELGYADGQMSKVKRWNLALMCNRAVALNRKGIEVEYSEGQVNELGKRICDELKMEAAVNILRLLKNVPSAIASSARIENLKTNLLPRVEKLCQEISSGGNLLTDSTVAVEYRKLIRSHKDAEHPEGYGEFKAEDFISVISGMKDSHPPIFFLAYMSGTEVTRMLNSEIKLGKTTGFTKFCRDNGIVISCAEALNAGEPQAFLDFFGNYAQNSIDESKMYFFFTFNIKAKTEKFKKLAELRSALIPDDQQPLRELVYMNAYNDYVFGEDDIRISFDKKPKKIVELLIKRIKENV